MSSPNTPRTAFISKFHIYPSTIPPIRFGIKNTVLNIFVPFIPLVSKSANANEITFMVITETNVNFVVNHKAFKKFLSRVNAVT